MCFRTWLTWTCMLLLCFASIKAIKVIGRDASVTTGDDAQLFCEVIERTDLLTTIRWQIRTKKKPTNTDFLVITSSGKEHINRLRNRVKFAGNFIGLDGSILLSNVTILDEGIYTCMFSVFPSGRNETEICLRVQVSPVVTVGTDVPAVAGDTEGILATCTAANAKPAAEVSWSLGALNNTVKVQNTVTVDSEDRYTVKSNLIGTASKDLKQKKVQCVVTHPGLKQKLELNYTLDIHYPPQVVYISSAGDQGAFQCEADANPKPTSFTWSRYFPVSETLSSGVNSSLIVQLTPDSNGHYYCVASNQYGEAVGSFYMYDKTFIVKCTGVQGEKKTKNATESKTCWSLFILTLVAVCCFLIWKFELFQRVNKILRRDISQPVLTESSDHKEEH